MENNNESVEKIIVQVSDSRSNAVGICALVFSILSVFFLAIIFLPLAIIFSIVALLKKQYAWAISSLIICCIALYTSPTLWLLLGL